MAAENRLWSRRCRQSGRHLEVKIVVVVVVVEVKLFSSWYVGFGDDGYDDEEDGLCLWSGRHLKVKLFAMMILIFRTDCC